MCPSCPRRSEGAARVKRLACLCLVFLLLAGCGPEKTEPAPSPSATVPPTPAATPSPAPEPTVSVRTDWSGLTPYEPVTPIYTRRCEGWTDHLIPAADYGELLSFAGLRYPTRTLPLGSQDGQWVLYGDYKSRYGLVTKRGEVVVDPVYDGVFVPSFEEGSGEPIWDGDYPHLLILCADDGTGARYAAAGLDGRWCTPMEYEAYRPLDARHLLLRNGEGCVMISPEGREYFRAQGGADAWFRNFSWLGELALADGYLYDPDTGERLPAGPFYDVGEFSEGLAPARLTPDGLWGYIDRTGSWAVPPAFPPDSKYDWLCPNGFQRGLAWLTDADGRTVLIDRGGTAVVTVEEGELRAFEGGGTRWYVNYLPMEGTETVRVIAAYDAQGAPLAQPAAGEALYTTYGGLIRPTEDGTDFYRAGSVYHLGLTCTAVIETAGNYAHLYDAATDCRALVTLDGEVIGGYDQGISYISFLSPEGGDYGDGTGEPVIRVDFKDGSSVLAYREQPYSYPQAELTYVEEDWGCGYRRSDGSWAFRWPYLNLDEEELE